MLSRMIDEEALTQVVNPYFDLRINHWAFAEIIEASIPHEYERDEDEKEFWTDW